MRTIIVKRDNPGTIDHYIGRFKTLITTGVESFHKAGKLLCKMVGKDPKCFHKIIERSPWMTFELLNAFVRVGKGELYPYLLLDQSPGARRIMEFPIADQKRYFTDTIEIATLISGEVVTRHRRLQEFTRKDVDVVFCDKGVRPIREQRSLLLDDLRSRRNVSPKSEEDTDQSEEGPEQEEPEKEEVVTIDSVLVKAQLAMLKVRELFGSKNTPSIEKHITNALNAIGGIRFEMKQLNGSKNGNGSHPRSQKNRIALPCVADLAN